MKKILLAGLISAGIGAYANKQVGSELLAVSTPTYNQINKIKGGLFGYRSVDTTTDNNGNKITNCQNPGLKRCLASAEIVVGETTWTPEQAEELDKYVTSIVTLEHTSGTFLYNGSCVVSFEYNVDRNALSYSVYSIQSATENGLVW